MTIYRIREFARNMKEAFNLVDKGEDVVIYRKEKVYILKEPINPDLYKEKFFKKG